MFILLMIKTSIVKQEPEVSNLNITEDNNSGHV